MSRKKPRSAEYRRVLILRTVGNFLVFSSLLFIVKTFYLPFREELRYSFESLFKKKYIVEDQLSLPSQPMTADRRGLLAKALTGNQTEILRPKDPDFSVVIPKVGANANIIPNVDAADEGEYLAALQKGVAHALGSTFPGEGGHIFLFAHSTDYFWNMGTYNAVFYLLYKLDVHDEIDIFYKGQRYAYKVVSKEIVDPSQVQYITRKTNKEFLTLQTCWPPGTTLKRLLVFATRVAD